ncbi:MAG: Calx-beta domain-containing protein [Acidimicrobiales bacterium]
MSDAYSLAMNTTLTVPAPGVLANDSDPDGDPLTAGMPSGPSHGTLSLSMNGGFTYTPTANYTGSDTWTYMAHDPDGGMVETTVTMTVGGGGGTSPSLAVNDVSVTEGNTGATTNAVFTITRTGSTSAASSVQVATMNGTAMAGSDYTAVATTTVNFAAGVTTRTVTVPVLGDNVDEANETYSVKLSSPTGATISDATGAGTIVDDDDSGATSSLAISNAKVNEGNTGTVNANFTITRTGSTAGTVKVKYRTIDNTAVAGSDYIAVAPTLVTFNPGETTKTVTVAVLGDTLNEENEKFSVKLTNPVGATIVDPKGVGVIIDNE